MKLTSPAFQDGQEIDQKYGKKNDNISVPLTWEDAPEGTKSFALSCVDHHPVAQNYIHWMVINISPDVTELPENAAAGHMPLGSLELVPYAGPFPPSGTHEYTFTLYALDASSLDLADGARLETFEEAVRKHRLESATLIGTFTNLSKPE
jgi:Raf kinase inhibitor-like YbhB/YbcL family protein